MISECKAVNTQLDMNENLYIYDAREVDEDTDKNTSRRMGKGFVNFACRRTLA